MSNKQRIRTQRGKVPTMADDMMPDPDAQAQGRELPAWAHVQPGPFTALCDTFVTADSEGNPHGVVSLRVEHVNGSFVQLMEPEHALAIAAGLTGAAEAIAAGPVPALTVPKQELIVPGR